MPEKKKQHYVPRFYLNFFTIDSKFYIYNVNKKENIGQHPYLDQCYENYFYGKNKIWENKLDDLEGKWKNAFLAVLENDYSYIDEIREFAMFQYARTIGFNNRLTETASLQFLEFIKSQLAYEGMTVSDEKIKEITDKKARDSVKPSLNLDLIEKFKYTVSDLSFLRIHYNTYKKLITSDNPVLIINPYLPPHVGLTMIGIIILFPMSPSDLGVFYDGKLYSKFNKQNLLISDKQSEVNHLNSLIYANSNELIFSINPFDNITISESNARLRERNKQHRNVQAIGPENNKLVLTQLPTIYHDFNFSFAKINHDFNVINYDYRDFVPRKFDEKFQQKLYEKFQYPFIDIAWKNFNIDKEKYKEGYRDFYELILKYWGKNES